MPRYLPLAIAIVVGLTALTARAGQPSEDTVLFDFGGGDWPVVGTTKIPVAGNWKPFQTLNGTHENHGFFLHGDSNDYMSMYTPLAGEVRGRPALLVIYEPKP